MLLGNCESKESEGTHHKIFITTFARKKPGKIRVQFLIQKIPAINKRQCTVLWDNGAQILLITNQYAKEAGFKGCRASIQISGVKSRNARRSPRYSTVHS
jgi:hypothetical protein